MFRVSLVPFTLICDVSTSESPNEFELLTAQTLEIRNMRLKMKGFSKTNVKDVEKLKV